MHNTITFFYYILSCKSWNLLYTYLPLHSFIQIPNDPHTYQNDYNKKPHLVLYLFKKKKKKKKKQKREF
ncbi:hypothetical protein XELAEV_18017575mg [Xenopus laevis]|uniref:Uncharacterized protein n=1 Tax=Xenopus laevis TaxID=8355 RepID=A0A974DBE8_XENLA|nr:hypothetical protein XELAEV_18017575mg [Xenopus laevis]